MKVKYYSSSTSLKIINTKIAALEATFMKKWRDSNFVNDEHFNQENEDWTHRILEVRIKNLFRKLILFYQKSQ